MLLLSLSLSLSLSLLLLLFQWLLLCLFIWLCVWHSFTGIAGAEAEEEKEDTISDVEAVAFGDLIYIEGT